MILNAKAVMMLKKALQEGMVTKFNDGEITFSDKEIIMTKNSEEVIAALIQKSFELDK